MLLKHFELFFFYKQRYETAVTQILRDAGLEPMSKPDQKFVPFPNFKGGKCYPLMNDKYDEYSIKLEMRLNGISHSL